MLQNNLSDGVKPTVLHSKWAARNRHVLLMATVVSTPISVTTVRYRRLIAHTPHVVQPYTSCAWPVAISNYSAIVSKVHKYQNMQRVHFLWYNHRRINYFGPLGPYTPFELRKISDMAKNAT